MTPRNLGLPGVQIHADGESEPMPYANAPGRPDIYMAKRARLLTC